MGNKMHAHTGTLQHTVRVSPQIDQNLEIGIGSELDWNKSEKQCAMWPAEGARIIVGYAFVIYKMDLDDADLL